MLCRYNLANKNHYNIVHSAPKEGRLTPSDSGSRSSKVASKCTELSCSHTEESCKG